MTISAFVNNRRTPDGHPVGGRGARRRYREEKRREAEERQAAYEKLLATGPDDVRIYRNRAVRPRLGRKLREAVTP